MKKSIIILICGLLINPVCFGQNISGMRTLLSAEGKVLYGSEPNSLLVIDYPENISQVDEYLCMVDTPPMQVGIEARVVEVTLKGEHALGVNWRAFAQNNKLNMGEYALGSASSAAGPIGPLAQSIAFKNTYYPPGSTTTKEDPFTVAIFSDNINVVLQALANSLDTNLLSAPRVTTINNRPAEIKIIEARPWAEPQVTISDSGAQQVTWTINFSEIGIVLRATPTVNDDNQITMTLEPEISEKTDDLTLIAGGTTTGGVTTGGVTYRVQIIDKRTANTKVIIGDQQTLIIGGLIKEKKTTGVTKVPLLGDIPGLGWMFKHKLETKEKKELLIFVSPTIIKANTFAKNEKEERYGTGQWYQQTIKDKRHTEAVNKRERQEKLISSLDNLEEETSALVSRRKKLEQDIRNTHK